MLITEVYQLIKKSFIKPESAGAAPDDEPYSKKMVVIHERLYQLRDPTRVDFSDYLHAIIDEAIRPLILNRGDIAIEVRTEQVYMDIDTAALCGAMINELVVNSLDHAFPKGRGGRITVGLWKDDIGQYRLTVSDNGIGLPQGDVWRDGHTPGMSLVKMLVHQLNGKMEIECGKGAAFRIVFSGAQP